LEAGRGFPARRGRLAGAVLIAAVAGLAGCRSNAPAKVKTPEKPNQVEMTMGETRVTLEVADDPDSRRQGLMFRDSLLPDHGMFFVFPYDAIYPFWMKNTRIPLSIAFINSAGEIVGISQMQPFDTVTMYMPFRPFCYAIEMEQGWFGAHGVQKGDTLDIPLRP
jgi:uncharacterized membrane protein (UPF0127 family)